MLGMFKSANSFFSNTSIALFRYYSSECNGMQDKHRHRNTHVAVDEEHLSEEEKSVRKK